MATPEKNSLTVKTDIKASGEKVWKMWNEPEHIVKWNPASDHWHTSDENNKIKEGEKFFSRKESDNQSSKLDLEGTYNEVKAGELISYTMSDGKKVRLTFEGNENSTTVSSTFDIQDDIPEEAQQKSWQKVLDSFKQYVETN